MHYFRQKVGLHLQNCTNLKTSNHESKCCRNFTANLVLQYQSPSGARFKTSHWQIIALRSRYKITMYEIRYRLGVRGASSGGVSNVKQDELTARWVTVESPTYKTQKIIIAKNVFKSTTNNDFFNDYLVPCHQTLQRWYLGTWFKLDKILILYRSSSVIKSI